MPFKKGHKKLGGKVKGTPNKRNSFFEALDEIHTEEGDPVSIIKLFFDGLMTMPPFQRVDALLKLMEFAYPKQKNVELSNKEGEEGFKIIVERYK